MEIRKYFEMNHNKNILKCHAAKAVPKKEITALNVHIRKGERLKSIA